MDWLALDCRTSSGKGAGKVEFEPVKAEADPDPCAINLAAIPEDVPASDVDAVLRTSLHLGRKVDRGVAESSESIFHLSKEANANLLLGDLP